MVGVKHAQDVLIENCFFNCGNYTAALQQHPGFQRCFMFLHPHCQHELTEHCRFFSEALSEYAKAKLRYTPVQFNPQNPSTPKYCLIFEKTNRKAAALFLFSC